MWTLLKSEIRYNWFIFAIYLAMSAAVPFLERSLADGGRFYVAILCFLIVQNWLALKGKEQRDLWLAKLPLSAKMLAGVRLGMIVFSMLLVVLVYKSMHLVLGIQGHANYPVTPWRLVYFFAFVLFGFSIYFLIADILSPRLRESGHFVITKERLTTVLILLALVLNIFGIYAFLAQPAFLEHVFKAIFVNNPFDSVKNIQLLLVASLALATATLLSYSKRRNYLP